MLFDVAPSFYLFSLGGRWYGNFYYYRWFGHKRIEIHSYRELLRNNIGRKVEEKVLFLLRFLFLLKYYFVRTVVLSVIKHTHTHSLSLYLRKVPPLAVQADID